MAGVGRIDIPTLIATAACPCKFSVISATFRLDRSGRKKKSEISEAEGEIFKLAFEAGRLFSCGADKIVWQYDAAGKLERSYSGHKDWVYALTIDAARKRFATGSFDGEIRLWNFESGKLIKSFQATAGLEDQTALK